MSSYRVINFINGDFISFPMEGENYSGTTFTYEEDKDGPATRNHISLAIKDFLVDLEDMYENYFGEKPDIHKILIFDNSEFYEFEEWGKLDGEAGDCEMYLALNNTIPSEDLDAMLRSIANHHFYANFEGDDNNLITQGYWEGEYNTGFYNMDNPDAYTYGHDYAGEGSYVPASDDHKETVDKFNKVLEML